jgi:hypothetical protein
MVRRNQTHQVGMTSLECGIESHNPSAEADEQSHSSGPTAVVPTFEKTTTTNQY